MNFNAPEQISKVLFWQQIALFVLSIFLVVMWGVMIFYFAQFLDLVNQSSEWSPMNKSVFLLFAFFAAILATGSAIDYILFQSISAFKRYLNSNSLEDLAVAFRKQRQFWMGLSLLVIFGVVFIFFLLFLGVG